MSRFEAWRRDLDRRPLATLSAEEQAAERLAHDLARGLRVIAAAAPRAKLVAHLAREPRRARQACVWCGRAIEPNHGVIEMAGRQLHDGNGRDCRGEFDALVYGAR